MECKAEYYEECDLTMGHSTKSIRTVIGKWIRSINIVGAENMAKYK